MVVFSEVGKNRGEQPGMFSVPACMCLCGHVYVRA